FCFFFFQAEDGIRDRTVTGVQTCALPIFNLSLATDESSDGSDALSRTVDRAVGAGMVVCVAAGNSGPDRYTIGSPAAAAEAITRSEERRVGKECREGWSAEQ